MDQLATRTPKLVIEQIGDEFRTPRMEVDLVALGCRGRIEDQMAELVDRMAAHWIPVETCR